MTNYISFIFAITVIASIHLLDQKIINGQKIDIISQAPFQVFILINHTFCSGAILNDRFVMTAAHCTFNRSATAISIRAGSSIKNEGGQVVKGEQKYEHPKYSESYRVRYDIVIISITRLTLGTEHKAVPVTLPSSDQQWPPLTPVTVSGWGRTESQKNSYCLKSIEVYLISNSGCKSLFTDGHWIAKSISDDIICTLNKKKYLRTCSGDSGSPLVLKNSNIVLGLDSWGIKDCSNKSPTVYTSVAHPPIRQFIKEITGL